MKSRATSKFLKAYAALPSEIQERCRKAHEIFLENPRHPSLRFKTVHDTEPIYSARVSRGYRALGVLSEDTVAWFWVGGHREYERLLRRF